MRTSRPAVPLLSLTLLASVLMLAAALILQHAFGWEPCTLCVQIRLWLSLVAVLTFALLVAIRLHVRPLQLLLWPLVLASSGLAVYDNAHLVLIETGVLESFSCSPFPFYSQYLPLHEYLPGMFMSAGICGQNDYNIVGLPFTVWTLVGVTALLALLLVAATRAVRNARR